MSDQPQANALASAFPTPPPFWQSFTPENTFRIEELRVAHAGPDYKATDPATTLPIRLLDLPAELRLLQPPEPPSDGTYRCFGDTYNVRTPSNRTASEE
jgi:mediator of RNA polymerase II transcription subunit 7